MTEKIAKKVGEAYAFAAVLEKTFIDNEAVMSTLLGDHATTVIAGATSQREQLEAIATTAGTAEMVLPKAEKTGAKITKMADMYVGDDWDDVAEVLEWMSFFIGGAIVHWQLIAGAAKEMGNDEFTAIATGGTEYYVALMDQLRMYAETVGKDRAQA